MTRTRNPTEYSHPLSPVLDPLDLSIKSEKQISSTQRLSYLNLAITLSEETIYLKLKLEQQSRSRFPYQFGPYPNPYSFLRSVQFLGLACIGRLAQVCKLWNYQMKAPNVWVALFESEGIPRVEEGNGTHRNLKEDLRVLYPTNTTGVYLMRRSIVFRYRYPKPFCFSGTFDRNRCKYYLKQIGDSLPIS